MHIYDKLYDLIITKNFFKMRELKFPRQAIIYMGGIMQKVPNVPSHCQTKRRMGARGPAHPFFAMIHNH